MLKNRKWLSATAGIGLIAILAAPALSGGGPSTIPAMKDSGLALLQTPSAERSEAGDAAVTFVQALRERDPATLWMFASEEEQDAFATEEATYEAYAEAFPALTQTGKLTLQRSWNEGDTPFVEYVLTSNGGQEFRVTIGLWLDDANDWKVVSCDVAALSDRVAGL